MPDFVVSATLVAEIEIELEGTVSGAVYKPAGEIVPMLPFPPATPFTIQLTAVLLVLATEAENCTVWLIVTAAVAGVTDTEMLPVGGGDIVGRVAASPPPPAHPIREIHEHRARARTLNWPGFMRVPCARL